MEERLFGYSSKMNLELLQPFEEKLVKYKVQSMEKGKRKHAEDRTGKDRPGIFIGEGKKDEK